MSKLLDGGYFNGPKPIRLLRRLLTLANTSPDALILDFFSGSATTANAVMQLNAEDGGNRRFIMVQLPEKTSEDSEAYKAGYPTICEIGKERIRRAGARIREAAGLTAGEMDTGFRVFRLDSTNMQDVYYHPDALTQDILDATVDNVKHDRTPADLLYQVMLDLGIPLSSPVEEVTMGGSQVFRVNGDYLLACFDKNLSLDTATEMAKAKPYCAVFFNGGLTDDSVGTNVEQVFKLYSPGTENG